MFSVWCQFYSILKCQSVKFYSIPKQRLSLKCRYWLSYISVTPGSGTMVGTEREILGFEVSR